MDQNNDDKGIDLSGALDNSSSGVKFEDEEFQRPAQTFQTQMPKVIQWVIKYSNGYIKDEKQASYAVFGFVALAIIISLFLIFGGGREAEIKAPAGQRVIYPQNEPPRLQQSF